MRLANRPLDTRDAKRASVGAQHTIHLRPAEV
jgi:hypothetical protein